jgi:hypothetical protein
MALLSVTEIFEIIFSPFLKGLSGAIKIRENIKQEKLRKKSKVSGCLL